MSRSEKVQTDDLVRDADEPIARDDTSQLEPLFATDRASELRSRWQRLQSRFVDDPRETVQEADALVAELLQELAQSFSDARARLEAQWTEGEDASTEDLRVTLQRYRSFFERLLAA
jgi:hypothetical protein